MRLYRKWRRLLLVAILVHLAVCLMITSFLQSPDQEGLTWRNTFFKMTNDPFGSRNWNPCPGTEYGYQKGAVPRSSPSRGMPNTCPWTKEATQTDITMELVLDKVSVGYPNLVLTVTGWVDTIQVDAWTVKPLQVIVIPHSHQDPGWIDTVDEYFRTKTVNTLDVMVEELTDNPTWTFIWAEVIFLQMWWSTASERKRLQFKRLVERGQVELVNGGLVMPDETVTHYAAILDQLGEGHAWIKDTFNKTIENSWAIDPFGHSSTLAYVAREAGIKNIVLQRVHFALKRHMASRKQLEFHWRQLWDVHGGTDVFCHIMPFLLYSIPHSCGPDRHVCCKFDFHKKQCFHGKKLKELIEVTDDNVDELATELWEQLQKKAELYKSHVVLLPHGDDFRYRTAEEWDQQFTNMQKLMDHINNNPAMNMKIRFGTLKDYFDTVHATSKETFPSLGGDLLPYSDRGDQYWSGIFTSRPAFKYLARQLQYMLRSAEILFSMSSRLVTVNTNMTSLYETLETSRRTLALCQHHDAITGTSRNAVMNDYKRRVLKAIDQTLNVQRQSTNTILHHRNTHYLNLSDGLPETVLLKSNELPAELIVWNSLGTRRRDVVSVKVDTRGLHVINASQRRVKYQISPAWTSSGTMEIDTFMLSFEVDIPPVSFSSYIIKPSSAVRAYTAKVSFINTHLDISLKRPEAFDVKYITTDTIVLRNKILTARFSTCDGMLQNVDNHITGDIHSSDLHYVTYSTGRNTHPFRDKSGAYIFLPDGVAKVLTEKPTVTVIEGPLLSQVRTVYRDIIHTATVYNLSDPRDPLCGGVSIENQVDMSSDRWDNMELALRMETNVVNDDLHFCSDSNGFQLHKRKTRSKLTKQGNFYPMTTMAMIENTHQRFSVISTQSHGVASLSSGWLEFMLDRRLMQDDWRGLSEGVQDNALTKSNFFILFEQVHRPSKIVKRNDYMCFPSMSSNYINDMLNNPVSVFKQNLKLPGKTTPLIHTEPTPMPSKFGLPCGYHIVNMKMLNPKRSAEKQVLLTIHRVGLECDVLDYMNGACSNTSAVLLSALPLDVSSVSEMTITGVTEIKLLNERESLDIQPMTIKTYKITFR